MSLQQRQKTRSYTYRIPMDDRRAMRKINRLQSLDSGYSIHKLGKRDVPNYGAARHWEYVFYESKELRSLENGVTGGTIPGLHEYRYSLDWEPMPHNENLEMRNANAGGTRIKGEKYVGTSDPRISNYAPIDTVVPWTPTEIKQMFNGQTVPDKKNYSHDPPEIESGEAREMLRDELRWAERDGLEELREKLHEYMENCDHEHVVTTGSEYSEVAYCEDCGKDWDKDGFEYERDELTVVGEV